MLCRHCQSRRANRPRGLCWSCYYRPGVRERFPSASKFGRWADASAAAARSGAAQLADGTDADGSPRPAPALPEPTAALPRSAAKLQVLADRAALRLTLWHPADAAVGERDSVPCERGGDVRRGRPVGLRIMTARAGGPRIFKAPRFEIKPRSAA